MLPIIYNELECNYSSYAKLFLGVPGVGKTTTFFRISEQLYGRRSALLLTLGHEPQPKHIRGAAYLHMQSFEQLISTIKELCANRTTKYSHIREIGIDTIDELFRLADDYVVREYNMQQKDASKKVKTVSAAYGGFQKGENRVVDLVTQTCFVLSSFGYGITFLGHSKYKMVKDQVTEIETEVLTCSLDNKYYNAIKNKVNFVGMAYYDVEFEGVSKKKDVYSKEMKDVAERVVSKKPVIVFKDTGFVVDCKSHFGNIAEKVDFTPEAIITAIYDAIKEELALDLGIDEVTDEKLAEIQAEQYKEIIETVETQVEEAAKAEEAAKMVADRATMIAEIGKAAAGLSKEKQSQIMDIIRESGADSISTLSDEALLKAYQLLKA